MRRLSSITVLTLTLTSAVAVAAVAQDSVRARREPRTFIFQQGPGGEMSALEHHGRLGITVDLRPDASHDSMGARVSGVTPGGPADHAGVQTGDIITRLNGTPVTATDNRRGGDDEEQSRPGMRLINLASRLNPGDTVRLDLTRNGRPMNLSLVADRTEMDDMVERIRPMMRNGMSGLSFGEDDGMGMGMGGAGQLHIMSDMRPLGDLELVRVNTQLAEGLGIPEGLLVVSADSGSTLGLRAGDVITSIGGRHAGSPPQAMRILSTYEAGESVAFEVMRQHRRITVNGKMPENRRGQWRVRPDNFNDDDDSDMMPMVEMPRLELRQEPNGLIRAPREMPKVMLRSEAKV
ncbi:MAG TPA: PDZ domain-containing protein [Gemmatimonadales bacterium]|jgi:C-terminal processing protease CtpA/Prc